MAPSNFLLWLAALDVMTLLPWFKPVPIAVTVLSLSL
jgi:hypothetical protein